MPCQKKKGTPPCMTPTRRVLDSLTIANVPTGRVIYLPSSLTPSPSNSNVCLCHNDICAPGSCRTLKKPSASHLRKGSCQEQKKPKATCARGCEGTNGISLNDIPCCQELLRKLAKEALSYNPECPEIDKRVCIRDPEERAPCVDPPCVAIKPEYNLSTCPAKTKPPCMTPAHSCTKLSKTKLCCDIPDCNDSQIIDPMFPCTHQMKTTCKIKPICPKDDCSLPSCARVCTPKEKPCCVKPPTAPIPCRSSASIATNSSQVLFGMLLKKNCECDSNTGIKKKDCHCDKTKREKDKKKSTKTDKVEVLTKKCSRKKCAVNTCPCRFPPAYSQYYDCTGQISGNCQCGRNT